VNIEMQFKYDIAFRDKNGEEKGYDNFIAKTPASIGDHILWHSCELKVTKIVHFVHGDNPTLECELF